MIKVKEVSKNYELGSRKEVSQALQPFSLTVGKGEFVTILGPSGCGKSTLLNIIAGFISPSTGEVLCEDEIVAGPSAKRVIVFQEHNLFPWKTVLANVAFGLKATGMKKKERQKRAQKYIELVHLSGCEKKYPYQLSGGMKQRVALARALAVEPECILMDEPLGSLDPQMRERLQQELLLIWKQTKTTIIMVTHDVEEAVFLSQRVMVLRKEVSGPSTIIPITLPYPRTIETRLADDFYALCRKLRERLMY